MQWFIVRIQPRITTVEGTLIPDLCSWKDTTYIVCDMAVGSDNADLDKIHLSKSKYYLLGIHQWMKEINPVSTLKAESPHSKLEGSNL